MNSVIIDFVLNTWKIRVILLTINVRLIEPLVKGEYII